MRFKIDRTSWYDGEYDILSVYPILKEYEPEIDFPYENKTVPRLTVEISSISKLLKLQQRIGKEIILGKLEGVYYLEIYDDYRE